MAYFFDYGKLQNALSSPDEMFSCNFRHSALTLKEYCNNCIARDSSFPPTGAVNETSATRLFSNEGSFRYVSRRPGTGSNER